MTVAVCPPDEPLSENFLDYKNRGVNGSHKGHIVWKIEASSYCPESEYAQRLLLDSQWGERFVLFYGGDVTDVSDQ